MRLPWTSEVLEKILFQGEVEEFEYLDIKLAILHTNVLLAVSQKIQDILKEGSQKLKSPEKKAV